MIGLKNDMLHSKGSIESIDLYDSLYMGLSFDDGTSGDFAGNVTPTNNAMSFPVGNLVGSNMASFSGNNSRIVVPNDGTLYGGSDFTLHFVLDADTGVGGSVRWVFTTPLTGPGDAGWRVFMDSNGLVIDTRGDGGVGFRSTRIIFPALTLNQKYVVTIRKKGDAITSWLDGVKSEKGTGWADKFGASGNDLHIGCASYAVSTNEFDGTMDEIIWHTRALNDSEIDLLQSESIAGNSILV